MLNRVRIKKTFKNSWYFNDNFTLIFFKFWVVSLIEEMFKAFKLHWVLYVISLLMFIMNKAKTLILFFFKWFNNVLNEAMFILWIENDSFWAVIETSCLSIIKILVWVIEENEVDCNQLECFKLSEIEKIEIEVFNWFKKQWCCFAYSVIFRFYSFKAYSIWLHDDQYQLSTLIQLISYDFQWWDWIEFYEWLSF